MQRPPQRVKTSTGANLTHLWRGVAVGTNLRVRPLQLMEYLAKADRRLYVPLKILWNVFLIQNKRHCSGKFLQCRFYLTFCQPFAMLEKTF